MSTSRTISFGFPHSLLEGLAVPFDLGFILVFLAVRKQVVCAVAVPTFARRSSRSSIGVPCCEGASLLASSWKPTLLAVLHAAVHVLCVPTEFGDVRPYWVSARLVSLRSNLFLLLRERPVELGIART